MGSSNQTIIIMHKFFTTNRKLIESEIKRLIAQSIKDSHGSHIWSKDALKRLENFILGGKMIRGLLVVLASEPKTSQQMKDAVKVGAMLEMMHSSILVHDDIMDRDAKRRGRDTIHTQYQKTMHLKDDTENLHYGESMASCVAIVGYFLSIQQFSAIQNTKALPGLIALFSKEMALLGAAQMEDVDSSTNPNHINESVVARIYEQKTGRYTFALPLLAGLSLHQKTAKVNKRLVYSLAQHLGIIFQLKDDYLGIFGNSEKTGKSVGGDIREKKRTWLYFELLKSCKPSEVKLVKNLYTNGHILTLKEQQLVLDLFTKYEIEQKVNTEMKVHYLKAHRLIEKLPITSSSKTIAVSLLDFLMTREK